MSARLLPFARRFQAAAHNLRGDCKRGGTRRLPVHTPRRMSALPVIAGGRFTPLSDRTFAFDELWTLTARTDSSVMAAKIVVRVN